MELTQQCEYVKIRFGRLPKRGYAMLQKDFTSDPYILFVPCSEDDKALWGVYFAPKKDAARVDGIFSEAFFERIRLPGAAGTPEQIVKNLQKNIDILNSEIAEVNGQMARLWNEEKWKAPASTLRCAALPGCLSFAAALRCGARISSTACGWRSRIFRHSPKAVPVWAG